MKRERCGWGGRDMDGEGEVNRDRGRHNEGVYTCVYREPVYPKDGRGRICSWGSNVENGVREGRENGRGICISYNTLRRDVASL